MFSIPMPVKTEVLINILLQILFHHVFSLETVKFSSQRFNVDIKM